MKSFLQLVEEKESTHRPVVMAFGRMNPPTTGHLKLIDKVRSTADRLGAKHTVILSHSQDSKKNPLSSEQKIKHLKRFSPGTHFETSSKESPTIMHTAAKLHAAGHDHLHVIAGSDRVKEYHDLLQKYNGVEGRHGYYNFKKITVHSAGHRDPDAEGAEGMSGTKMREHAKNKDFSSFRQGVPGHVSDTHARELMHDVRKGMGLNESVNHGRFKAVFVTGGPGSGKDLVIREAIPLASAVELNVVQAHDYIADKHALSEHSNDYRRETIRNRGPLIINGPADDIQRISYIKEELEELGYETLMIFVHTSDEISQERNTRLSRMMVESVRHDKWIRSQNNKNMYFDMFEHMIEFDNSDSIIEENVSDIYQITKNFFKMAVTNDASISWLEMNGKLNTEETSKSIQKSSIKKYNPFYQPAPPTTTGDQLKGDMNPRKDPNGKGHSGGAWHGAYTEESKPMMKFSAPPKEPNFRMDKDKLNVRKRGDKSLSASRIGKPPGVGPEYDTRAGGQGAAAGAGLGQNLYGEDYPGPTASNADVSNFAGTTGVSVNPLDARYQNNNFNKFRKKLKKEAIDDPGAVDMGVGGTLGGASNKEGMDTYKDPMRNIKTEFGLKIKKKKGAK
jgi:cytidyltransferase-like protein